MRSLIVGQESLEGPNLLVGQERDEALLGDESDDIAVAVALDALGLEDKRKESSGTRMIVVVGEADNIRHVVGNEVGYLADEFTYMEL